MDACVEVLVKEHSEVIVAECPKLIAANQVESKWHSRRYCMSTPFVYLRCTIHVLIMAVTHFLGSMRCMVEVTYIYSMYTHCTLEVPQNLSVTWQHGEMRQGRCSICLSASRYMHALVM